MATVRRPNGLPVQRLVARDDEFTGHSALVPLPCVPAESGRGCMLLRRKVARAFRGLVYASLGFRFHPLRTQKEMKQ